MKTLPKIFKHKHKHRWTIEKRINNDVHMLWTLRKCKCGRVELLYNGGTGDKKWHIFDGSFRFDWERMWFEKAKVL